MLINLPSTENIGILIPISYYLFEKVLFFFFVVHGQSNSMADQSSHDILIVLLSL